MTAWTSRRRTTSIVPRARIIARRCGPSSRSASRYFTDAERGFVKGALAMRLRQIALVAKDLSEAQADAAAVLGVDYAYDDPGVGKYGLRNAVFPVGDTFLEIVSPKTSGTTAGRPLEKSGGGGGDLGSQQR